MSKVHKQREQREQERNWREVREREEDGFQSGAEKWVMDFDPTAPEDVGGVVVDTPVDIDLSD